MLLQFLSYTRDQIYKYRISYEACFRHIKSGDRYCCRFPRMLNLASFLDPSIFPSTSAEQPSGSVKSRRSYLFMCWLQNHKRTMGSVRQKFCCCWHWIGLSPMHNEITKEHCRYYAWWNGKPLLFVKEKTQCVEQWMALIRKQKRNELHDLYIPTEFGDSWWKELFVHRACSQLQHLASSGQSHKYANKADLNCEA